MQLSVDSPYQYVTWKVRDFFQLPSQIGYSLDSPEFLFAGDSYCLRLYPNGSRRYKDKPRTELELLRLTSTFPERSVSCKVGYRCRYKNGDEVDRYLSSSSLINKLRLVRSTLQDNRDMFVPGGTLTALYSMRLKEQNSARNPKFEEVKSSDTKDRHKGLSGQSLFFSSRSWSFKMELSIESPCQHVTWKVPNFFQLLSKIGYSLNSPEFRFAGDRYCLRFNAKRNSNGDTVDTDLQLARLTSTFPERIVSYKVGYSGRSESGEEYDIYDYSGELIGDFGFCVSRSQLERVKDMCVPDGNLAVLCSMCMKEQLSARSSQVEEAGNSHAKETREGLSAGNGISHHFAKTTVPGSVSCAISAENASSLIGKENPKDENLSSLDTKDDTILRDRMKELLTKGSDYDVTICVQDKKFRAHRNILSARSPVFAKMLSHDKENNTGSISIEDCDPDSFAEFLFYVYSGRTENLSPSNALQLYYSADKYNFPVLKERCVSLLKASLSITSICNVVLLAAKHQEKELLEVATEFFARNMKQIIATDGWQNFLSRNPVEANELFMKSMEILLPEN